MVLKGVGAVNKNPNAMGMFMGRKELKRIIQGMNSPVSGCTAVETIDWQRRTSAISL